ncbi:MAG: PRC-barrel domain-containing protein [Opitutales bacterium]
MENESIKKFGFYFSDSLEGRTMQATDGEIGKCEDVLFYDKRGHVAYFVVDTGNWFTENKVLIAPAGIDSEETRAKAPGALEHIPSTLTREKVEASPPYDADKPVSDEYRERLAEYYKWPYEVGDAALWGPSVFSSETAAGRSDSAPDPRDVEEESNHTLRSAKEVIGYKVMSQENTEIGEIADLVLDTTLWALPYLRVRESAVVRPRDLIVPWEYVEAFSLASENIRTSLDAALLKNAPDAPQEEEFSDSALEASIRNYYRLS